jgi:hypothetical protein
VIDNSNSNAATDCPASKKTGTFNGVDVYECGGETNREKAVMSAYDLLTNIATKEPGNKLAVSRIAIASFPTVENYVDGWAVRSNFVNASSGNRAAVKSAMAFARKPWGLTPYGSAMSAATQIFGAAASDKRAKVAVLVTDGEPTDRDPPRVAKLAADLRASGVQVITVFVTSGEVRAARISKHTQMMQGIDDASVQQGAGHWYKTTQYASFSAYMAALVGGGSEPGLVARVSNKVVEVQDSTALRAAFLKIIKTQAIGCER